MDTSFGYCCVFVFVLFLLLFYVIEFYLFIFFSGGVLRIENHELGHFARDCGI